MPPLLKWFYCVCFHLLQMEHIRVDPSIWSNHHTEKSQTTETGVVRTRAGDSERGCFTLSKGVLLSREESWLQPPARPSPSCSQGPFMLLGSSRNRCCPWSLRWAWPPWRVRTDAVPRVSRGWGEARIPEWQEGRKTRAKEEIICLLKNWIFKFQRYLKLLILLRLSHEMSDS